MSCIVTASVLLRLNVSAARIYFPVTVTGGTGRHLYRRRFRYWNRRSQWIDWYQWCSTDISRRVGVVPRIRDFAGPGSCPMTRGQLNRLCSCTGMTVEQAKALVDAIERALPAVTDDRVRTDAEQLALEVRAESDSEAPKPGRFKELATKAMTSLATSIATTAGSDFGKAIIEAALPLVS
jgi:hypothetical protein